MPRVWKKGVVRNGEIARQVHGLSGSQTIPRQRYRCRDCHRSFYGPNGFFESLDGHLVTETVWAFALQLAVYLPYGQTCRVMDELLGVTLSPPWLQRELVSRGQAESEHESAQSHQEAQFGRAPDPGNPSQARRRHYVEMDGCFVHKWHENAGFELKLGTIFSDPVLTESGKRKWIEHKEYVSHCGDSDEFGERLFTRGEAWQLTQAKELYVLGDGASWIKSLWSHYFPHGQFILDWWHLQKAVWRTVRSVVRSAKDRKKWSESITDLLFAGQVQEAVVHIGELPGDTRKDREARNALIRYVKQNSEGIWDYDALRDQDIHIGSGVIENSCMDVIGRRMKHRGMTWSHHGAKAILCLRTAHINGRWNDYWTQRGSRNAA